MHDLIDEVQPKGHLVLKKTSVQDDFVERMEIPRGQPVIKSTRVLIVKKRPEAFLVDILSEWVLTEDELINGYTGSALYLFLLKHIQIKLEKSYSEIQAVISFADIAHALQIQRGDVLLHSISDFFTISSNIINHSLSYFLPGYFHFNVAGPWEGRNKIIIWR